jgi:hypothetical protein
MALVAAALAPASPAAAAQITFEHRMGTTCVGGVKPAGGTLTATLLRPDGRRRDRKRDDDGDPSWQVCFRVKPRPGDRIRAVQGSVNRTIRVPDLTIVIDRVADVVSGRAPAGREVTIQATTCFVACLTPLTRTTTANAHGRYRRGLPLDMNGSDLASAIYSTAAGDQFQAFASAPWFEVTTPGRAAVWCTPPRAHEVTLRRPDGSGRASASPLRGVCDDRLPQTRRLTRPNGRAVTVRAGNILKSDVASDARFAWPVMSVEVLPDGASGECFKDAPFMVIAVRPVGGSLVGVGSLGAGETLPDGTFVTSVGSPPVLQVGDRIRLICESPRGDRAILERVFTQTT